MRLRLQLVTPGCQVGSLLALPRAIAELPEHAPLLTTQIAWGASTLYYLIRGKPPQQNLRTYSWSMAIIHLTASPR